MDIDMIKVNDKFEIGKYPITQGQWKAVMRNNPSYFNAFAKSPNHPVEQVSWDDVQEFIKKLNEKTGLNYRLPTDEEWLEAAGTPPEDIQKYAHCNSNATAPVGFKLPNELGIYDMFGNVWEWTSTNSNGLYILRGGSWIRSVWRISIECLKSDPNSDINRFGFRLARTIGKNEMYCKDCIAFCIYAGKKKFNVCDDFKPRITPKDKVNCKDCKPDLECESAGKTSGDTCRDYKPTNISKENKMGEPVKTETHQNDCEYCKADCPLAGTVDSGSKLPCEKWTDKEFITTFENAQDCKKCEHESCRSMQIEDDTNYCSDFKPITDFRNAQVGDKVDDLVYGEGGILIIWGNNRELRVLFPNSGLIKDYAFNGVLTPYCSSTNSKNINRTLYYAGTKVSIEAAPEPVRKLNVSNDPSAIPEEWMKIMSEYKPSEVAEAMKRFHYDPPVGEPASEPEKKPPLKEWICRHSKCASPCELKTSTKPYSCVTEADWDLAADWKLKEVKNGDNI